MLCSLRYRSRPEAESTSTATTNSTRVNCSPPATPPLSASQTGHQSNTRPHKENLVPSSSTHTSPLNHTLQRQKSLSHIIGASIPVLQHQDHQAHRVTTDHSPRAENNWSATFPRRSFIPVPQSPKKDRSPLPIPITTAPTKSIRFQRPGDTSKPNLSSLFNQDNQKSTIPSSPKSSSPTSTKFKAPLLQTQVRAEERQRLRLRLEEMGRKNRGKGSKKTRPSNDVEDVEASSSVPASTTPVVEDSVGSGGAVQAQSAVVDGIESQALPGPATAATITPPETFTMPDIASAMSSPTTFHSAFGSPVSDSTSSGIFDYAMTGNELVSTDKIKVSMLDSVPNDNSGLGADAAASSSKVASTSSESFTPQADIQEESAGKLT